MIPQAYCRKVCQKSKSNFVYTFYLFGKRRRRALETFYAFCRKVDDAVDQADSKEKAVQAIHYWKAELSLLASGKPSHPITQALLPVLKTYAIPQQYLQEIVLGCEMDLTKKTYATFAELETYCFRVASCVGLVCLHIFGVALTAETQKAGLALGKALQLTNILRDVVTDLRRERVYLPQEDLIRFGVTVEDLAHKNPDPIALLDLLYFEISRARTYYQEAWRLFPKTGREKRRLLAAFIMGRFYEALLDKIGQNPCQIFQTKVHLTRQEKLSIALNEIWNVWL